MATARDAKRRRALAALILVDLFEEEGQKNVARKRNRVFWTRDWIKRRRTRGVYHQLVKELELEDEVAYTEYFRVNGQKFRFLVDSVGYAIKKKDTLMRESIRPDERIAVTLRCLATGETFKSLEYSFRISRTCISSIVVETCQAIFDILGPRYLNTPSSQEEWESVAQRFESRWNFPNGIGALDGKRILIQQPQNSGSRYYDYKGHSSIILMAVFGGDYECLWADVGANGRASDGGVWQRSDLKSLLSSEANPLNLPDARPLPGRVMPVPYVLTGDDAFALTDYLLKPYPQSKMTVEERIFNYRLSRMRRISENGFGILVSRWRIFCTPMLLEPGKVKHIVLAALTLHNLLR